MFKDRQKGLLLVSTGALMWGGSGVAGQYLRTYASYYGSSCTQTEHP